MSYTKRNPDRVALGDAMDTVTQVAASVDPYFPEALCRIKQLRALKTGRTPLQILIGKKPTETVPTCTSTPPGRGGVGVEKAIKPLRAGVYVAQHPMTVWLGVTAILGVPLLVGYMIGKRSR